MSLPKEQHKFILQDDGKIYLMDGDSDVEVSNQDEVLDKLWRQDERINSPIPFLFWKENMLPRPKGAVYSLLCSVEKVDIGWDRPIQALVTFSKPEEKGTQEEEQFEIWLEATDYLRATGEKYPFAMILTHLQSKYDITRKK